MPKFKTDDQVRVRESSGVWNRRGQVGTVITYGAGEVDVKFTDSQIRYTFSESELEPVRDIPKYRTGDLVRLTDDPDKGKTAKLTEHCDMNPRRWHMVPQDATDRRLDGFWCRDEDRIELVVPDKPKPEFQVGDQVLVTKGSRTGQQAVVKEIRQSGGVRLQFSDRERTLPYSAVEVELAVRPVRLVGITGRKRTGKDTVAARLIEKHGFKRLAFADNVRKMALAIDPYVAPAEIGGKFIANLRLSSIVESVGWEAAKDFPEVRRLLQKIGTEGIRSLEPDFWIRQVMRRAVVSSAPVVITDVRFPNEADAIKKAGGVILRVRRPGQDEGDQHSSESAMDDYLHDWSLLNSGTVEELHRKVDELVVSGFKPA